MPSRWYHSSRFGSVVIRAGSWTGTTAGLSMNPGESGSRIWSRPSPRKP